MDPIIVDILYYDMDGNVLDMPVKGSGVKYYPELYITINNGIFAQTIYSDCYIDTMYDDYAKYYLLNVDHYPCVTISKTCRGFMVNNIPLNNEMNQMLSEKLGDNAKVLPYCYQHTIDDDDTYIVYPLTA